jgi:hypothetical protein
MLTITAIQYWRGRDAYMLIMISQLYAFLFHFINKVSIWHLLPVTISELRKAQLWIVMGFTCILPVTGIAFGFAFASFLIPLEVSHREILAFLSTAIFMGTSILIAIFTFQITRNKIGRIYSEFLPFLPVFVSLFAALKLTFGNDHTLEFLNLLIFFGAVSLFLLLTALIWNHKLPLVLPVNSDRSLNGRYTEPSFTASSRFDRPPARRSGVWALLASSLGHLAAYAGIAGGVFATVVLATNYGRLPAFPSPMLVLQFAPLLCAFLAFPALMEPQRVRGGLPVSAFGRTLAWHLVVPALLLPAWVFMIASGTLLHPEAMTPRWWIGCGMTSLLAWSFGAIIPPVALRLGRLGVGLLSGVLTMLVGIKSGLGTDEGRPDGSMSLAIIGLLIITLIAGWVWTYVGLAYWRKAYQAQGLAADRWRGAAT